MQNVSFAPAAEAPEDHVAPARAETPQPAEQDDAGPPAGEGRTPGSPTGNAWAGAEDPIEAAREIAAHQAQEGRVDEALAILEPLRRQYPDNTALLYDYVVDLTWKGSFAEAADLSGGFIGQAVPSHVLAVAAMSHRHAGRLAEAEAMYREGIERFPYTPDFVIGQALTLTDARRYPEARAVLEAALLAGDEVDETRAHIDAQEAAGLARSGRNDEALARFAELRRRRPDDKALQYEHITVLSWAERHQEAADLAQGTDHLTEAPVYVLSAAARSYRESGRLDQAQAMYEYALDKYPDQADLLEGLVMTLTARGRPDEVKTLVDRYRTGEQTAPQSPAARPPAGAFAPAAEEGPALAPAEEAVRAKEIERRAAVAVARQGDYATGIASLERLHQADPGDRETLAEYITVLVWAGRNDQATGLTGQLDWDAAPEYAVASAAAALRKSGRLDQAQTAYDRGAARFPRSRDLAIGRALTLGDRNAPAQGLAILRDVDERNISPEERKNLAEARRYLQRMLPPPPPYVIPARTETPWRVRQDGAVQLAREGRLNDALAILADLHQQYPRDQYLLGDYLVLLRWSPNHDQAIALARQWQNFKTAPAYAVITVAYSLAAKRNYHQARQYLEAALRAQRRRPELLAMSAQLVAMHGDFFRAADWLDEAEASRIPGLGHLTSALKREIGYLRVLSLRDLESANRRLAADFWNGGQSLWLKTIALSGVGGAHEARSLFHRGAPLRPAEIHNIKMAAGRKESYWGELISDIRDLEMHNRWFEISLASLRRLAYRPDCASAVGVDCQTWALQATVQPLYQLNRLREATDVYEATVAAGSEPTDAVLLSAGGAYIGQRRPLKAIAPYQAMIDRRERVEPEVRPDDVYEGERGLFWAYLESEMLQRARAHAREVHAALASPPPGQGRPLPDEDWRKTDSLNTLGQAELFTGWTGNAEDHFDAFLAKAPANADALNSRSTTRSMRGLPRGAWRDAVVGRLHAPDSLPLALREAHALMDLREWRAAEKLIKELAPWSSYDGSVKQLERRWETHNLRELRISTAWAKSDSNNPNGVNATNLPSLTWRLYSQPLWYNWRAFVGSGWDAGEFEEGTAHQQLTLGGIEYRGRDLEAALEARADQVEDRRFGLGLTGVYEYDDHWSFPFSLQKLSPETPLRARRSNITADSASLGVGHYWNDYRWMNLNAMFMNFSDGNERASLSGDFNQRLWTWYTHYLNGQISFAASRNSETGDEVSRPYFNPKSDREFGLGLTYGAVLWRDYDRVWRHEISAGAGDYRQEDYGSDLIWNVGYSQSLDWGDRFSATYGAGYARRVYDGDPERDLSTFLTIVWRF